MKKFMIALLGLALFSTLRAQKTYYTPSGGILGGANFSSFRFGDNKGQYDAKSNTAFAGGVYANFPLSKTFSIEPQVLYSRMGGELTNPVGGTQQYDQELDYISVPLLFKFHAGRYVGLFLGPQFDFLMDVKNKPTLPGGIGNNKDDFKSTDIAGTAGLEIFPHERVVIYGRYIYGFNQIKEDKTPEIFNQGIQAGVKIKLFGRRVTVPPPPPPPPPPDTDRDGIIDSLDKCPTQAGLEKYNGCPIPDTDGDGVNDEEDKCPSQAGVAKYNGCPIPDTDGDGINDEEDKCPNQAGIAKYNGCPIPDKDGDGINDEEDKCPTITGVRENGGCPAIPKFKAGNIQFVTGSAKLTPNAINSLTPLLDYMRQYPEIKLEINGHTDNVGKAEFNKTLSEKRAATVLEALVQRGIDRERLTSNGYGMEQPIADNVTKEGKAQNRRVEFKFNQ